MTSAHLRWCARTRTRLPPSYLKTTRTLRSFPAIRSRSCPCFPYQGLDCAADSLRDGANRRWDMQINWIKAQAPRRVLALVKHLDLEAECIEMDMMAGALKTSWYAALNPN